MNQAQQFASNMIADAEHKMKNDQFALEILAELGVEVCEWRDFKDDDWYTYNTDTMQCLPDNGSSKNPEWKEPAPFKVVRGMAAKCLGLWRYTNESRHNRIIINETLANNALYESAAA